MLFWKVIWLGNCELYKSFSRLFQLSKVHNVSVRSFVDIWSAPNSDSNTSWSRQLRAWDLDEAMRLNDIIDSIIFSSGMDYLLWIRTSKAYSSVDGRRFLSKRE